MPFQAPETLDWPRSLPAQGKYGSSRRNFRMMFWPLFHKYVCCDYPREAKARWILGANGPNLAAKNREEGSWMVAKANRSRRATEPDHVLVANIESSDFTYFISGGGPDHSFVDDEAIIELHTTVSDAELSPKAVGQRLDCSLVCARRFRDEGDPKASGLPALYSIVFRQGTGSMLAYLPADAFWAVQARLEAKTLKQIEVRYLKPARGSGAVQSIYLR